MAEKMFRRLRLEILALNIWFIMGAACIKPDNSTDIKTGYNESSCTETDGWIDYNQKGMLVYTKGDQVTVKTDECHPNSSNKLTEHYCDNNNFFSVDHDCLDGCEDGACIECELESIVMCESNILTEKTTNKCTGKTRVETHDCEYTWIPDNRRIKGICKDFGESVAGCVPCNYRGCFSTKFRIYDQCYSRPEMWHYRLWVQPVPSNQSCPPGQVNFGVAGVDFGQKICEQLATPSHL